MTHHFHSVVSIDHAQAVIFEFSADDVSEHRIKATDRSVRATPMTANPI